ncbi:hypothetical protein KBD59_02080 [Candidatus Gracilibacteria bacterium]|nr:hypothetical protein [Candidatus Gracilibacteria bacterium]
MSGEDIESKRASGDQHEVASIILTPGELIENAINTFSVPPSPEPERPLQTFDRIQYQTCKDALPSMQAKTDLSRFLGEMVASDEYDLLLEDYELLKSIPEFEEEVGNAVMRLCDQESSLALPYLLQFADRDPTFVQQPKVAAALHVLGERLATSEPVNFLTYGSLWSHLSDANALYIRAVEAVQGLNDGGITLIAAYNTYKDFVVDPQGILFSAVAKAINKGEIDAVFNHWKTIAENVSEDLQVKVLSRMAEISPEKVIRSYQLFPELLLKGEVVGLAFSRLQPGVDVECWYSLPSEFRAKCSERNVNILVQIQESLLSLVKYQPGVMKRLSPLIKDDQAAEAILAQAQAWREENERTKRTVAHVTAGNDDPDYSIDSLMEDPALSPEKLRNIARMIPRDYIVAPGDALKLSVYVARNLFQRLQLSSKENVVEECRRIQEMKNKYGDMPLFYKRNILFVSHNERENLGFTRRFGKKALIAELERQQESDGSQKIYHTQSEGNSRAALIKAEGETERTIADTPPPLTFVFDGHGGPDVLELAAVNRNNAFITAEEFANAWLKRSARFGAEVVSKDIVIFASCYNHNFVRKVYDILAKRKAGAFISVGSSEYGQVAYDDTDDGLETNFYRKSLKVTSARSTLKDVWNSEENGELNQTNPYVYIPDNDFPMELTYEQKDDQENEKGA